MLNCILCRFCFIEHVNPCESHYWCVRVVVVDAGFLEFIFAWELMGWLSCFFYKFVCQNLCHFDTVIWFVWRYFPLEYRLLWMELHPVEWILSCLPDSDKSFIEWRYCLGSNFPKITQFFGIVICTPHNCFLVIVVCNTLTCG